MSAYEQAVTDSRDASRALTLLATEYNRDEQVQRAKFAAAQKIIAAAENGESAEVFAAGALYLDVRWGDPRFEGPGRFQTAEVNSAFESVIAALRTNDDVLLNYDGGVKRYEAWLSQNETWVGHYVSPAHGSLWFRVGLRRGWAADRPREYLMPPTEEDRLLCIQYLKAIQRRPELL